MKKWMKGIAITGIVLLLVGTAVTALAAVVGNATQEHGIVGNWAERHFDDGLMEHIEDTLRLNSRRYRNSRSHSIDSGRYDDSGYDSDSYDNLNICPKEEMELAGTYKGITKLEVEAERSAVKIVENPELTDEINVYMKNDTYTIIDIDSDDEPGQLSVKYSWPSRKYSWSSGDSGYTQGIIEIPVGYRFREAELEAKASFIKADYVNADELDASVKAGELQLGSFQAGKADFSVEAGSITAYGDVEREMEAEVKAGAATVELAGGEKDYNFYLDNAVGSVLLGDSVYSGLSNDTKVNNGSDKIVKIDCSAGTVEVRFSDKN
ncbi:hypothetical protein [Clostridium transplantifaecale]|uniref:hypothetical protein n=1 Tax=Clostridium transplantifaecale TaxID=2479838 RepID=UPI000F63E5F7|nr:hypothetical protein [Clostridium transplantifaecale]